MKVRLIDIVLLKNVTLFITLSIPTGFIPLANQDKTCGV